MIIIKGVINKTCFNPLIKFNEDFYKVLQLNKKFISFKNYQHLSKFNWNLKNLVATGRIENLYKCRHCEECLATKKIDWFLRCKNEVLNNWKNIYFITLTFDNEHYNQHTKKRLLSIFMQNSFTRLIGKENYKYFAVSEYGEKTGRFHYHVLLYTNYFFDDLTALHKSKKGNMMQYKSDFLTDYWKYGFHTITRVQNDGALKYCIKYTCKQQNLKVYCSRGFGNFIKDFDNVNLMLIPNSVLINANARMYNAYRRYRKHEITKQVLFDVWKKNERYALIKERRNKLLTFNKLHNVDNLTYRNLLTAYNTANMHRINCKREL